MNKLLPPILLIVSIVCSCQKLSDRELGKWDPIELSQSEVIFDAAGGSCTVEAINYSVWWINGIRDIVTGTYYHADAGENYSYSSASGDGISVKLGTKQNTVVITVDPSSGKHDWFVAMEAGDAFTSIRVRQDRSSP